MPFKIDDFPMTPKTRTALVLAKREAGRLRHAEVRVPHIMLGMMREGTCFGYHLMRCWSVDMEALGHDLAAVAGPRDEERMQPDIPWSREAQKFLREANDLRESCSQQYLGTDHFLLLQTLQSEEPESIALRAHGIVRDSIFRVFREGVGGPENVTFTEGPLVQVLARTGRLGPMFAVINRLPEEGAPRTPVREAFLSAGQDEEAFLGVLTSEMGYERFGPDDAIDEEVAALLPGALAMRLRALPVRRADGMVCLACLDPFAEDLAAVGQMMGARLRLLVTDEETLAEAIDRFHDG